MTGALTHRAQCIPDECLSASHAVTRLALATSPGRWGVGAVSTLQMGKRRHGGIQPFAQDRLALKWQNSDLVAVCVQHLKGWGWSLEPVL